MTKQDFEAIAATIHGLVRGLTVDPANDHLLFDYIAREFADMLATTNPRFNRGKFLRACDPWSVK